MGGGGGGEVIRGYTGCTFQTFVNHFESAIFPSFFQRFSLKLF